VLRRVPDCITHVICCVTDGIAHVVRRVSHGFAYAVSCVAKAVAYAMSRVTKAVTHTICYIPEVFATAWAPWIANVFQWIATGVARRLRATILATAGVVTLCECGFMIASQTKRTTNPRRPHLFSRMRWWRGRHTAVAVVALGCGRQTGDRRSSRSIAGCKRRPLLVIACRIMLKIARTIPVRVVGGLGH
jgi:hypothetical protein